MLECKHNRVNIDDGSRGAIGVQQQLPYLKGGGLRAAAFGYRVRIGEYAPAPVVEVPGGPIFSMARPNHPVRGRPLVTIKRCSFGGSHGCGAQIEALNDDGEHDGPG